MTDKALPWRVPVAVATIPEAGLHRDIEAGEAERAAIAALANLRELQHLAASFDLVHAGGGRVHVQGRVRASVGQTCVVTLEPLSSEVDEAIDVMFAPGPVTASAAGSSDHEQEVFAEDPPEPLVNGEVDLGALAAEFLILGLDPYPRKEGAAFEPVIAPSDPADHPFAALAKLKTADSTAKPRESKGKTKRK